ncbi:CTP synthase 2 [Strongyloides ratti]|uniref:CTP synthase (glutamine hydrolyzing) n=1 Tax=Strongyloides ratti TaxID=34506 RepID=A0A090LUC0_STRRB|nr:CTP synthase 2 [Strongyloides ratti]CEF71189.1 CTP synthase 2 [Strongyloides ratti]
MPEHVRKNVDMEGTIRLGLKKNFFLTKECKLQKLYKSVIIKERHRHRYEVKPTIVPKLSEAGLLFVGIGVDNSSNTYINQKKTLSANNLIKMTTSSHSESLLQTVNKICSISSDDKSNTNVCMEILEMRDHPYFVGCQYHPEYLSHPITLSPPFFGLLLAASGQIEEFFL